MPSELQQIKDTVDGIGTAFAAFRDQHQREIAEIKAQGSASAETQTAVDRANAQITALEATLERQQQALREVEGATARLSLSPADRKDQERDHAQAFFNQIAAARKEPPVTVGAEQVEQYRAYRGALHAYLRNPQRAQGTPAIMAALTIGSDPAGGYMVLPDTTGRVVELLRESSPMRKYAFIQPIGTDRLVGFNDLDEDDAAAGWTGESSPRVETGTPDFGRWEIPAHEQFANPRASQNLLDDAVIDIEGWLAKKVAGRLARREATAFVAGNGVAKPRGFTTYAHASAPTADNWQRVEFVKTGANGGFVAAPNGGDVFIDTIATLKEGYLPGAIWAMSRLTKAAVRKLKDSNGHYLLLPDFRDGFQERLLGLEVAGFEDMPAIATGSLSIALANFGEGYTIVDRQGIRVLRDPYTNKPFVHFYTTRRVGGDVTNFEAIKLIKFTA